MQYACVRLRIQTGQVFEISDSCGAHVRDVASASVGMLGFRIRFDGLVKKTRDDSGRRIKGTRGTPKQGRLRSDGFGCYSRAEVRTTFHNSKAMLRRTAQRQKAYRGLGSESRTTMETSGTAHTSTLQRLGRAYRPVYSRNSTESV